ncbi:MAG: alpha/beta fold hydrolase [Ruminococcus sp.]|nr:alpha/beta fold hydrolase [Ruminococcus sp.]
MKLTLETNGFETEYIRFGKEGAQPMLVLPGLSLLSVLTFEEGIVSAYGCYARDRDVILPDRRKQLPDGYTLDDMADDTADFLDALGIKNADVMGVSQGGMIAQVLAVKRPDLVRSLALCSTSARLPDESKKTLGGWITAAKQGDADELVRAFAENVYSPEYYEKYKAGILGMARLTGENELERFAALAKATEGFDLSDKLSEIKAPSKVFAGSEDRMFGTECQRELSDGLGCELCVFGGYGHAVYDEMQGFHDKVNEFFHSV